MRRRTRWVTGAWFVAGALALAGCEDSAEGFGGGVGKAIGLLLLLGLVLPATIVGLVVLTVTTLRRRGGAPHGGPPPPPPPPPRPLP